MDKRILEAAANWMKAHSQAVPKGEMPNVEQINATIREVRLTPFHETSLSDQDRNGRSSTRDECRLNVKGTRYCG